VLRGKAYDEFRILQHAPEFFHSALGSGPEFLEKPFQQVLFPLPPRLHRLAQLKGLLRKTTAILRKHRKDTIGDNAVPEVVWVYTIAWIDHPRRQPLGIEHVRVQNIKLLRHPFQGGVETHQGSQTCLVPGSDEFECSHEVGAHHNHDRACLALDIGDDLACVFHKLSDRSAASRVIQALRKQDQLRPEGDDMLEVAFHGAGSTRAVVCRTSRGDDVGADSIVVHRNRLQLAVVDRIG
jgi:hypothetical protein